MNTRSEKGGGSTLAPEHPRVSGIRFERGSMVVDLEDGRALAVPLEWFPKLRDATAAQRKNWRAIGKGIGIHWPQLDEDISVRGLLLPETALTSKSKIA